MRENRTVRARTLAKWLLRGTDRLLSAVCLIALLAVGGLAAYIVVDTGRLMSEADSAQYRALRPDAAGGAASFGLLVARNPEVVAWLTLEDTGVDYPVTQGKNNQKYINTSALGEFSLSGAIFADARNAPDFSDTLTILYGHNMTGEAMFGSLDRYEDGDYFAGHLHGTLYHGGQYDALEVFAFFETSSHALDIYRPELGQEELGDWLELVRARAVHYREGVAEGGPILLMSTCAVGETEGRRLVAARILPGAGRPAAEAAGDGGQAARLVQRPQRAGGVPWLPLAAAFLALSALSWLAWRRKRRRGT